MRVGILGIKHIPGVMGADRTVESLLRWLPQEHHYTVYVVRNGQRPSDSRPNVHYVRIPALQGKHLHAATYFALSSLHAAVLGRYDVAHVHNSDFGAFCLPLRIAGTKVVGTFHGDPHAREKWGRFAKRFLLFSERAFVRSAEQLTSVTPVKRVRGREIHYIPNGIDAWTGAHREGGDLLTRLGVARGQYLMFACGRLDPTKGLHHLVEAFKGLDTESKLLVVGDPSHDRAYMRGIEASAAADPRIIIRTQLLPRDELLHAVSHSAAFVFPSETEGMAMMLLEAISCGATVVCSDIPENLAVVGEHYPLLFRSASPADLRDMLRRVLAQGTPPSFVTTLREEVLTRFRWDVAARQYARVYELG